MARDLDFYLLDQVFQPASDAVSEHVSCFDLARASLIGAVVMQTTVLVWNLHMLGDPTQLAIAALGTLAEYVAAQSVRSQIARMERQSRPGLMNVARITYRPFRLMWVGFAALAVVLGMHSEFRAIDLCNVGVGFGWILTVYFMCCARRTTQRRRARGFSGSMVFGGA